MALQDNDTASPSRSKTQRKTKKSPAKKLNESVVADMSLAEFGRKAHASLARCT